MLKTLKRRLYPSCKQAMLLNGQLDGCRWLYDLFLEERNTAWDERPDRLINDQQAGPLPALQGERPGLRRVHAQVLPNVAVRRDAAMKAVVRRFQAGDPPGYPRVRGRKRSVRPTFPQAPGGARLHDTPLDVFHVGAVKRIALRPLEGMPTPVTLRRANAGKGFVTTACAWEPTALPPTGHDGGLAPFAAGQDIATPRLFRHEDHVLATAHRALAHEDNGTPTRRKLVARRRARRREDFTQRRRGVEQRDRRATSMPAGAWGQRCAHQGIKAAWAGRHCVAAPPADTTQHCTGCGQRKSDLTLGARGDHGADGGLVIAPS
jgi:putative transposase